jgi:hypothetical protein
MPRESAADRWQCTNPVCGREVPVESGREVPGSNPPCACGAPMKKKYVSPALSYLEFLRVDEPLVPRGSSRGG